MMNHHPSPEETTLNFLTNGRSRMVVQPLFIVFLVSALFVGFYLLVERVFIGMPWRAIWPLFFLIPLEGIYTTLWLYHPDRRTVARLDYRLAEWVFLLCLIRLYTWFVIQDTWPTLAQLLTYLRYPFSFFNDTFFVFSLLFLFVAWWLAVAYVNMFNSLTVSPLEAQFYNLPLNERQKQAYNRPLPVDRSRLVEDLFHQWLWGGVLLTICAALTSYNWQAVTFKTLFSWPQLGLPSEMLIVLLVYFLAGFGLLSQARLAVINAHWLADGVNKGQSVEASWHRYSLWLVGLIALVAAFLPIGSTLAIGRIVDILVFVVIFLLNVIVTLFVSLISLILALFGASAPANLQPQQPLRLDEALPPQSTPPPVDDTLGILLSSLFWAVIIVMTATTILFFLRDRGLKLNRPLLQRLWNAVVQWWRNGWLGVSTQVAEIKQALQNRLKRPSSPTLPSPSWRFIRLNALSPREQIRYFYLAAVRRAGEQGVARKPAETPLEFNQDLKQTWPDAGADVDLLTDAFLKARYTPQPVEKEEVNPIKAGWKRIKSHLRKPYKNHW